jgi:uncharacterized membrane protein
MAMGPFPQVATALALASGLAYHGLRKRSLTSGGAVAAFCVGFGMRHVCACRGPAGFCWRCVYLPVMSPSRLSVAVSFVASTRGGILLIAFYQTGSTLTKLRATEKAKLDASSDDASGSHHFLSLEAVCLSSALRAKSRPWRVTGPRLLGTCSLHLRGLGGYQRGWR